MPTKGDTGTGGFPIDSKVYTYDVGGDGSAVGKTPWSSGEVSVDQAPHDLSDVTKRTLADYLSKTTHGAVGSAKKGNAYPIEHAAGAPPTDITLTDSDGYPVGPSRVPQNQPAFSPNIPPGRSRDSANLNILRGRERPGSSADPKDAKLVDGNRLLPGAATPVLAPQPGVNMTSLSPDSPVASYSSAILNNRFTQDEQYEPAASSQFGLRQYAIKYPSGQSLPPNDPSRDVSYGRLAQIGTILSARAGLEKGSRTDGASPNPSSATLPGMAQLGVEKVANQLLQARDVLDHLTTEEIGDGQVISPMDKSWGTLNNVLDQFTGASNFGMQLLALALVAALGVIFGLLSVIFLISPGTSIDRDVSGDRRLPMGTSNLTRPGANYSTPMGILKAIFSGDFNFWEAIGVRVTVHPLKKALPAGMLAFFGFDGTSFLNIALDGGAALSESPGYYSIVARMVARSFVSIADGIRGLRPGFSLNFATQIFNLLDMFRNSKFIRILNVFTQIGDQVLNTNSDWYDPDAGGSPLPVYSKMNMAENTDAHQKSRLKGGDLHLAWSSYRAPDMLIAPIPYLASAALTRSDLGAPSLMPTMEAKSDAGIKYGGIYQAPEDASGRISAAMKDKLEMALEAEYLPFYFHDLRTNEIVSFHAFLASLTDGFTAQYDAQDAFGRIEAPRIYKSTGRKIGFSFHVAALSPQDFDSMWIKINKLVTLVYPQYTQGKTIKSANGKYTIQAPFSQLIGASPMIRVRIGDLIQSNYSKFNLARLFGYASPGTTFNDAPFDLTKTVSVDQALVPGSGYTFTFQGVLGKQVANGSKGETKTQRVTFPRGLVLTPKTSPANTDDVIAFEVALGTPEEFPGMTDADLEVVRQQYGTDSGAFAGQKIISKAWLIPKRDVVPTPTTLKKLSQAASSPYTASAADFMKNNAVTKSFTTVEGRGLAGFIDQLSFDWYDKVTWSGFGEEKVMGLKAPKMCKVSIDFTPIHDISPGLDHMGANRAPVYPVGPLAPTYAPKPDQGKQGR